MEIVLSVTIVKFCKIKLFHVEHIGGKMIRYFNGCEWVDMEEECFNGVNNLTNVDVIYSKGKYISVTYLDDTEQWYEDVFGTYIEVDF